MTRTPILRRCRIDWRVVILLAALVTTPVLGLVHTALRRSEPATGALLREAPRQLVLEFTERIALATARVVLRVDSTEPVALSPLRHADSTRRVIVADAVGPLRAGPYTVEWTVAGTDGHPVRGTFGFTIDSSATGLAPAAAPVEAATTDSSAERPARAASGESEALFRVSAIAGAVVRVLTYASILGLLGVAALQTFVIPRASLLDTATRDMLDARVARVGIVCVIGLLLVAGLRLVLQTVTLSGGSLVGGVMSGILRGTTWGRAWIWQVAVAALAGFVLRRRPGSRFLLLAACVPIALTASFSGHPVATPDRAAMAVAFDAVHVLAVGAWLGSLAVLAVVGIPMAMALAPPGRGGAVRAVFIRFSPMALVCASVLVLSGAIGALLQLGSLGALFVSDYGRVLLVKLGVFALLVAVAAYNWRRMLPQVEADDGVSRLRSSVRIELVLAVLVLVVTAVLTVTTPPVAEAMIPVP